MGRDVVKIEQDKLPEVHKMMAQTIAHVADLAVSRALEETSKSFHIFKKSIEDQANEMWGRAEKVMHIQINDEELARPLSQRASASLPRLIANAKLGLYSLMVGPAGCGKTTAAYQVAESLGLQFGSVCLTAGASETWLFGRQTPTGFVEGAFSKIYREGGVFLADEMDAADANLLLSINTALSHDTMLNPMNGEFIKRHPQFVFIGAANTNGKGSTHLYTGRSRLDAATLDRMVIVPVDYDQALEKELCDNKKMYKFLQAVREALKNEGFDEFISTRSFIFCNRQFKAGISLEDIKNSLFANWGDAARKTGEKIFSVSFNHDEREKNPKEKFYKKFVDPKQGDFVKWRPVEWEGSW